MYSTWVAKKHTGFFLIEVVVATAVIATVLVVLLGAISNSVDISSLALQRAQASYLLEEGAEAIKVIRDNAWTNITNLTPNTDYYFSWSGSTWTSTSTPNTNGIFTRTAQCENVSRDANNDIVATGGTNDAGTKKCTVTVRWTSTRGAQSESLSLYISNIN